MNNEVIIVYMSVFHGNTEKIARAMSTELNCRCIQADKISEEELKKYKYVGLGSGIYFTSHHPEIIKVAERLLGTQKAFVFSTRGCPFLGKYHNTIKSVLATNGVEVIGEFSCKGYDCTGPYNLVHGGNKNKPGDREILKARKFCLTILPEYSYNNKKIHSEEAVHINKDICINCNTCKNVCVMNVFNTLDGKTYASNMDNCVHCNLCVDNCPEQAISLNHSRKELIGIAKKFAGKKSL